MKSPKSSIFSPGAAIAVFMSLLFALALLTATGCENVVYSCNDMLRNFRLLAIFILTVVLFLLLYIADLKKQIKGGNQNGFIQKKEKKQMQLV